LFNITPIKTVKIFIPYCPYDIRIIVKINLSLFSIVAVFTVYSFYSYALIVVYIWLQLDSIQHINIKCIEPR